jgi:hypothetical protein
MNPEVIKSTRNTISKNTIKYNKNNSHYYKPYRTQVTVM